MHTKCEPPPQHIVSPYRICVANAHSPSHLSSTISSILSLKTQRGLSWPIIEGRLPLPILSYSKVVCLFFPLMSSCRSTQHTLTLFFTLSSPQFCDARLHQLLDSSLNVYIYRYKHTYNLIITEISVIIWLGS